MLNALIQEIRNKGDKIIKTIWTSGQKNQGRQNLPRPMSLVAVNWSK